MNHHLPCLISQDAYAKIKHSVSDEEAKQEERIVRRHLEMENARKEFEEELKLNRKSQRTRAANTKSLYDLRNDYERLQFLRFERQQKESEEKMLQHWRINNPDYREVRIVTKAFEGFGFKRPKSKFILNNSNNFFIVYSFNLKSAKKWFKKHGKTKSMKNKRKRKLKG